MSATAKTPLGPAGGATERARRNPKAVAALGIAENYLLAFLLAAIVIVFSILEPSTFGNLTNFKSILTQNASLGILALGALLPLIIGQFDLSVGANLGIGGILVTGLASKSGFNFIESVIATMVVCTLVGVVNGTLVAYLGIDAFITTLGMSALLAGVALWYTNGQEIYSGIPKALIALGQHQVLGIASPIVFLIVVAAIIWYLVHATPLGRYMYALGGSKEASRLSGLNTGRLTLFAFAGAGFLAGIAGIIQSGQLGAGDPTQGPPFLLPAFAAVFLGATSFRRGTFNVPGTIVAVFVIGAGISGLEAVGAPSYVSDVFTGLALVVAALGARWLSRHRTSNAKMP